MAKTVIAIVIFLVGISCGAWLPIVVALPISMITGGVAGMLFAQGIER